MFHSLSRYPNTFTSQAAVTMPSQHHIAALILIVSFTMFYKHYLFILTIAFFSYLQSNFFLFGEYRGSIKDHNLSMVETSSIKMCHLLTKEICPLGSWPDQGWVALIYANYCESTALNPNEPNRKKLLPNASDVRCKTAKF